MFSCVAFCVDSSLMCQFVLFFEFCSQLLHRVLVAEVNALQGMAAIGQRPLLMEVGELKLMGL